MIDRELAPQWRSKFCLWEVYSRCMNGHCEQHCNPCSKQEDCPQRDAQELRQAVTDNDTD